MMHGMAVGLGLGAMVGTGLRVGGGVGASVATGTAVASTGVGVSVAAEAGCVVEGVETAVAPPHAVSPNAMVDSKSRRGRMSKYPREAGALAGPLTHEVPDN